MTSSETKVSNKRILKDFLEFCKSKGDKRIIHEAGWRRCAVGEYLEFLGNSSTLCLWDLLYLFSRYSVPLQLLDGQVVRLRLRRVLDSSSLNSKHVPTYTHLVSLLEEAKEVIQVHPKGYQP